MSQNSLVEYLVTHEPAFRRARLPALYSDFQTQRTLNPDGYQANVSAWRKALSHVARSGLAPSPRGTSPSLFVLNCDEQLVRALESKQYGRPLALGAVVRESLAAKDLVPLQPFLAARESIYYRPWSVWNLASWTMRQLGVSDLLRSDSLPKGQFVVVANVEEVAKAFAAAASSQSQSRFERTFSKTHFVNTFNDQLVLGKRLSDTDADVLLTFLSRDKGAILYDGATVKIKTPGADEPEALTSEDASMAQLKELLAYLTHQTTLLSARVEELVATAKSAVAKQNRVAALAALRSKKHAEATLTQRFATLNQLEEVASKLEQAADNVALVKVMQASGDALRTLNARVGGTERVEEVVDRLREQMAASDEVSSILAENASTVVLDEGEIDDELEALEKDEKRKADEKEKAKEAEETRRRLEEAGKLPDKLPTAGEEEGKEKEGEKEKEQGLENAMSRMSLVVEEGPQAAS